MSIAPRTSISARPHRILLQNPGPPIADGAGGYTQVWSDLAPAAVDARIAPATAADLERVTTGTTLSTATHVVTMPYHPQVATSTRIIFNGRTFHVAGVATPDELQVETVALCTEVVP